MTQIDQRHQGPDGTYFVLEIEGATPEENARGAAAMEKIFLDADLHPYQAARAAFILETPVSGPDDPGPEMTTDESNWTDYWFGISDIGTEAACRDWPKDRPRVVISCGIDWPDLPQNKRYGPGTGETRKAVEALMARN